MKIKQIVQRSKKTLALLLIFGFIPTQLLLAATADQGLEGKAGKTGKGLSSWIDDQLGEGFEVGGIQINPRFRGEYSLDDNVLLEQGDGKGDSIFREIPGIEIIVPIQQHLITVDYEAEFEQFMKLPRENDENQYFKSEINLSFNKLYINLGDDITHTSSRSGTTFTKRSPRFENTAFVQAGYTFNRFTVESGYESFYRSFDNSSQNRLDLHTHKFTESIFFDLTEKVQTFVEYSITDFSYRNDTRDAFSNKILAGVTGDLFPKTSVYAKFGYENLEVQNSKDGNNFISQIGVIYTPFARTSIDAGYLRSQEQSTFSNTTIYKQDLLFLTVNQGITQKLSASASFYYINQDYETVNRFGAAGFIGDRDDDLITVDTKLVYEFTDWVSADVRYQYNRRSSNAAVFDYNNSIVTVGFTLTA